MNDLLLRACRREPVERPPVWLMRQAGRYLPEYRALRARHDFLTLLRTPELAAQVTSLPVDLLGVDAAILFSDILVIPMALGLELTVADGTGPVLGGRIRNDADVARLLPFEPEDSLAWQLEAIRLTVNTLAVPLIGFAGGPWTLASYMIEGRGSADFRLARRLLAESPALAHGLLDRLADAAGRSLAAQARAGARVLQVFESSAGALSPRDYQEFALPYLARAVRAARETGVPVIVFAPGANCPLDRTVRATGADVIGIDWRTDPAEARARLAECEVACQGNLDPALLFAPPSVIRERVAAMVAGFGHLGYIANLGHGVLPDTPVEHVRAFIDAVRLVARPGAAI
jgi:uroporphyrinogen decarboxylase